MVLCIRASTCERICVSVCAVRGDYNVQVCVCDELYGIIRYAKMIILLNLPFGIYAISRRYAQHPRVLYEADTPRATRDRVGTNDISSGTQHFTLQQSTHTYTKPQTNH